MSYESMVEAAPGLMGGPRGAGTAFVRGLRMVLLAILVMPAFAAAPTPGGAAQANPRLASLRVDIWPEFDRRAALIILKGELSPDVPLPAAVSLRIPATSGGPSAVAFANAAASELFTLPHEVASVGNDITVRFSASQRFFHVEYYDPLTMDGALRNYTYVWRGDFAVNRLSVSLQVPAAATDLSVLPDLGPGAAGPDGLVYRTLDLGAHEAGKQLLVVLRYTKADSRTSAEILKLAAPAETTPGSAGSSGSYPAWGPFLSAALGLVVGLGLPAIWWLWRRRKTAAAQKPAGARFCSRCGSALDSADRYCSSCGAPARRS